MKVFLAQMVFAARNDDSENWMQILVVVIMAVVYGLGGILKAAKSKKLDGKEGQEQQGRQPRPARTVARRVYEAYEAYQATSQPQRPKAARPEPVRSMAKSISLKPAPSKQLEAKIQEVPEIMPEIEKLPEFIGPSRLGLAETDETVATLRSGDAVSLRSMSKELQYKRSGVTVPAEIAEATYFGKPLLDVSDPEAIRRAILHYEIFGKPLSLREQERAF